MLRGVKGLVVIGRRPAEPGGGAGRQVRAGGSYYEYPVDILGLSIYSKVYQKRGAAGDRRSKYMLESKIVLALEKFKADYAWDKSLMISSGASTILAPRALVRHESNYLELFAASESARISRQLDGDRE